MVGCLIVSEIEEKYEAIQVRNHCKCMEMINNALLKKLE